MYMARRFISPDQVRTFGDVEREVAANSGSQPIDRMIAGLGERLLEAIERQFSRRPGQPIPEALVGSKKFRLPGRYVVAALNEGDLGNADPEAPNAEMPTSRAEELINRAIKRLFGQIRVSDLTKAQGRRGQLYALEYAGPFEGLGPLHGVQMQCIDAFTTAGDSVDANYFQRSMMDILDGGLGSFMGHKNHPSHVRWEQLGEMRRRNRTRHVEPAPLFASDTLSVVRVEGIGLEECMESLEHLCREVAVRVGEVARVQEEPRRRQKRAA